MRFKSIGFVAAMASMLTLPGCSSEVGATINTNNNLQIAFDSWDGTCQSSESVTRTMTAAGCQHQLSATVVVVPSVQQQYNQVLEDEGVSPDDADLSVDAVTLTARATSVQGTNITSVGDWSLNIPGYASLSGTSFTLNQPITISLTPAQLDQVEASVASGMPITATVQVTWIGNDAHAAGTLVTNLAVHVEATATVSWWSQVF
jgi:hypothetical protein